MRLGVALGVSGVCLWVAFRAVPVDELLASLRSANYWWLLAYPVLGTLLNIIRSEIWRRLLRGRATTTEAFWSYSVGFLVNNVLPFRMGEAARVVALATRCRIPVVEVATAAGLERLLDVVSLLIIVVGLLPFMTHLVDVGRAAWWSAGLAAALIASVSALVAGRRHVDRWADRVTSAVMPRYRPAIMKRWHELMNGLAVASDPAVAVPVIGGAAAVWALTLVLQWTVLRALQPEAGMIDAAVMVAVVSFGGAIPAAPGAIGTYQWVGQQALTVPFPVLYPPALALAAAVVSHAASYVFSTILGAIGLWYLGISLSQVSGEGRVADSALERV